MDTSMISKIQKAKRYAEEPKRVTFNSLAVIFRGDNSTYNTTLGPDGWHCTCPGFQKYGICPHTMALEKLFMPMLKRDPMPYASGQNIVSDVKKAKRYSEEPDRIEIVSFDAQFEGANSDHHIRYDTDQWSCNCSFFHRRGVCSHTMALEKLLKGMVKPISMAPAEPAE